MVIKCFGCLFIGGLGGVSGAGVIFGVFALGIDWCGRGMGVWVALMCLRVFSILGASLMRISD